MLTSWPDIVATCNIIDISSPNAPINDTEKVDFNYAIGTQRDWKINLHDVHIGLKKISSSYNRINFCVGVAIIRS